MSSPRRSVFVLALALLLSGCATFYRSETVLHSDGSVERAIYQPKGNDAHVQAQPSWQETRIVRDAGDASWPGDIRSLANEPDQSYVTAWGRFASPREIPPHVIFPTMDHSDRGELVREYQRHEWGLLREHVWCETLTDVVTLNGFHGAIDELATLLIGEIDHVLKFELGKQYELEPLLDWLDTDGRQWAQASGRVFYEHAARDGPLEDVKESLERELLIVAAQYGLDLRGDSGRLRSDLQESNEAFERAIQEFARRKLVELVRDRDGRPITDSAIDELIQAWRVIESRESEGVDERLKQAFERMVAERYGDEEKRKATYLRAVNALAGVYLLSSHHFRYTMQMPGIIVETNGRLAEPGRVLWSFNAEEAFPHGKRMFARSLEADAEQQKQLLGAVPLVTHEQLHRYLELMRKWPSLMEALNASIRTNSVAPLRERAQLLRTAGAARELAALDDLLKLLAIEL